MIVRIAFLILLLGTSASFGQGGEQSALEQQGQALAERLCSQCHATGKSGQSLHAAAPPFRDLGRRLNLDSLPDRLRDALLVGHPDMPAFRFTREDARAFMLYVRSIQIP